MRIKHTVAVLMFGMSSLVLALLRSPRHQALPPRPQKLPPLPRWVNQLSWPLSSSQALLPAGRRPVRLRPPCFPARLGPH